ncbi:N4-gp56 family major capsid protein [Pseudomonas paralcaligenes]|uniref:N4-gp56 family major capsid protein n=1 Tax=Pseudomonas paralcaligenes TaxID=2772558 RepID=UPI001C80DFED|nr:N4-gp56 family major capsid protein [Pseudomonas paralcaligenes]
MPTTQNSHAPYGDKKNMVQQAVGLFATHLKRNNKLSRLFGAMPKGEKGAIATIKKQTTEHMPFVRCMDLGKGTGDEITFHVVNPFGGIPIMGSEVAEGRGTGMSISEDRLRVNQARLPVKLSDNMTDIRSPVDFRKLGRPVAQATMDRYMDQSLIIHAAGARGHVYNPTVWAVPPEDDPRFASVMVNRVKAPTRNRHFIVDGDGVSSFKVNAGEMDIASTDKLSMSVVDSLRAVMDEMVMPPPIVKFEGDEAAEDEPLRLLLVTPLQYNQFAADPAFRSMQAAALARASNAKQHPIFKGEVGLWNNFLIMKQNIPIRFFAGGKIKYCASFTSEAETEVIVPESFGTNFAVDRAIILGGQAVGHALARSNKSGVPFFWSEKEFDHGDKVELLIGTIHGMSKFRFLINTGDREEYTDYGAGVLDTVVPLNSAFN